MIALAVVGWEILAWGLFYAALNSGGNAREAQRRREAYYREQARQQRDDDGA